MNIFEDLIDELKDENLLEETVVENNAAKENSGEKSENAVEKETPQPNQEMPDEVEATDDSMDEAEKAAIEQANFYRQRAMDEVAFLQTVEHVFAGIEREQLKTIPNPYDELRVKKVLHAFLQVSGDVNSPEYSKAEFELLKETENWYSALAERDKQMMTAHLRRFCETSRPPLSSPALVALARFYRNSPYSELTRSKFDLIATRLFSKEIGGNKREMVFSRDELVKHLKELYAEWSSVPLYSTEANNPQISQTVQQFKEFIRETGEVMRFDELINGNFFNRLHRFKESTNEDFYEPSIAAVAIEGNIRIGNRYIELLERAQQTGDTANLKSKYGIAHDQAISEATGKTLSLLELLQQKKTAPPIEGKSVAAVAESQPKEIKINEPEVSGGTNKWLVTVAMLAFIGLAIYFITNFSSTENNPVSVEQKEVVAPPKLNLQTSILKDYLQEAYIQDETLNGIVLPTWNNLTEDEKQNALKQMIKLGGEKGYKKVQLVVKDKTVATAADGSVSVLE